MCKLRIVFYKKTFTYDSEVGESWIFSFVYLGQALGIPAF